MFSHFLLSLFLFSTAHQGQFWNRPFTEWSSSEVDSLLNDSPWSGRVTIKTPAWDSNGNPAPETETVYTVRLFSALPVRLAYTRLFQLMNRYSALSESERISFDRKFSSEMPEARELVIISLDFESEDPSAGQWLRSTFSNLTLDQVRPNVRLTTGSGVELPLSLVSAPTPDGTGAKLAFFRTLDSRPLVGRGETRLELALTVPGPGHQIAYAWNLGDLVYQGRLEF